MIHGQRESKDEIDFGQGTSIQTRPYDHPKKIRVRADVEECGMMGGGPMNKGIANDDDDLEMGPGDNKFKDSEFDGGAEKPDNPRKHSNDINQVPNQSPKALYQSIRRQMSEFQNMSEDDKAGYKEYFANMLQKYGVSSPKDLDTVKKKDFFNAVDKGWKAKNEGWVNQIIRNR